MKRVIKTALPAVAISLVLQGCFPGPGTTLSAVGLGGHKMAMNQENINLRARAALEEEPDLFTFSIEAISKNTTEKSVGVYLTGYRSETNSEPVRALALYQSALIYMNLYNRDRDDQKAREYFDKILKEFDFKLLSERVKTRIQVLEERKKQVVILSADQYLMNWKERPHKPESIIPHDDDMKDLSARAISKDRIDEAVLLYTVMYENEGSSEELRAGSLYQIGLMLMSPYNKQADEKRAVHYFRKIQQEFPESRIVEAANRNLNYLLNKQKTIIQ
jgi:tetratricopeptide (TPR) repeat protein